MSEQTFNDDTNDTFHSPSELEKYYKEVFGTSAGKVVLKDLCHLFYMFHSTHGQRDSQDFCEGQRAVVLHLLEMTNGRYQKVVEDFYETDQGND